MNIFRTNWGFILLGAAVAIFDFVYMPQVVRTYFNSDSVFSSNFYQDVVVQGHTAKEWFWDGYTDLFPALTLTFGLHLIINNDFQVSQISFSFYFLAWIVGLILAYRETVDHHLEAFISGAVLLVVIWATVFIFVPGFCLTEAHADSIICLLFAWMLSMRVWRGGSRIALCFLAALTALASASDPFFLVWFTGPMAVSLASVPGLYQTQARRAITMLLTILGCSAVGYFGIFDVFPAHLSTSNYVQFDSEIIFRSFTALISCLMAFPLLYLPILVLDLGAVAICAGFIAVRGRQLSPTVFLVLANLGLIIMMNWGAVILTGNFVNGVEGRYLAGALMVPPIVILGFVIQAIPWNRSAIQVFAGAVAAVTLFCTLHPPKPSVSCARAPKIEPILRQFKEQGIRAGLSEYWFASSLTFLTKSEVPIRQILPNGGIYRWLNTLTWYDGDGNNSPQFRFIIMHDLNSDAIRARYGMPAQTMQVDSIGEIWVYAPEDCITYNKVFGDLGNRHCFPKQNSLVIDAGYLPFSQGHLEGTSRVAYAGKDSDGCLTSGPYLKLIPGQYSLVVNYAYSSPPFRGQLATYDSIITPDQDVPPLDQGAFPYHQPGPDTLKRTIIVPLTAKSINFEARTFFHGSADFRINSLTITYLGAPEKN